MSFPERFKSELSDDTKDLIDAAKYTVAQCGVAIGVLAPPAGVGELTRGRYLTGLTYFAGGVAAGLAGLKHSEGYTPIQDLQDYLEFRPKKAAFRLTMENVALQALRPPQPQEAEVFLHPAVVEEPVIARKKVSTAA